MLSYHSCHIYGTWKSIKVVGRFYSHHMDGKPQREGTIFIGGVDSSRHNVNILVRQLEEG